MEEIVVNSGTVLRVCKRDSDDGCIFICPIFSIATWTKNEVGERQLTHFQLKLGYQKVNLWAPLSFLSS